jgi:predicted HAD superfamily phosphohydrolase YqeG
VGVALVPIKEAAVPAKVVDQNQASLIRSSIKRLEYMLTDNALIGEKDPDITPKTTKLKDELKQAQIQLIDVPVVITDNMTEEELDNYFNSPKVNKKYRLKTK